MCERPTAVFRMRTLYNTSAERVGVDHRQHNQPERAVASGHFQETKGYRPPAGGRDTGIRRSARGIACGDGGIRQSTENHAASTVLQDAGHGDFDFLADHAGGLLADDHRAVIEITDALAH